MPTALITHGFPKSGGHALVKACQLLGHPCEVDHRTVAQGLPPDTTHDIFIVRDPRNVVVSMIRMRQQPVTPGMFLCTFRRFQTASLVEEMAAYADWLASAGLVVRYEDLMASPTVLQAMAAYLDTGYFGGAFEMLPGMTRTWNAVPSDYRDVWTDRVQEAWAEEGGSDLLDAWGY